MARRKVKVKTGGGRKAIAVAAVAFIALATLFLGGYNAYLDKPSPQTWDSVRDYLSGSGQYYMEPIIFSPDWLGNYATDLSRFQGFNLSSCSGCESYWLIQTREPEPPKGYHATLSEDVGGVRIMKLLSDNAVGWESAKSIILSDPTITIRSDGGVVPCVFEHGQLGPNCYDSENDWQIIRRTTISSGGARMPCIFVHPRNGKTISLLFHGVSLGESLRFQTGISDGMVGGDLSPVYMDVYVNGSLAGKIIHPDRDGWDTAIIDTGGYAGGTADVKLQVYADDDKRRHFCFNAYPSNEKAPNDYFLRNIMDAKADIDGKACGIRMSGPVWPHNETKPPLPDSEIFERWDCEDNLAQRGRIWNTVGRSFAVAGGEYRSAIWMHPETGKVKTLGYSRIGVYADRIVGYYGFNDYVVGKNGDAEITFTVTVNGRKAYEDTFGLSRGWKEYRIPVKGMVDDVEFHVTTTNDRWNHFFQNAYLD